jgi:hypothetical protein
MIRKAIINVTTILLTPNLAEIIPIIISIGLALIIL